MTKKIALFFLTILLVMSTVVSYGNQTTDVNGDVLLEILKKVQNHEGKDQIIEQLRDSFKDEEGIDTLKSILNLAIGEKEKKALEARGISDSDLKKSLDSLKKWDYDSRMELLDYVQNNEMEKAKDLIINDGKLPKEEANEDSKDSGSSGGGGGGGSAKDTDKENKPSTNDDIKKHDSEEEPKETKKPEETTSALTDIKGHWAEENIAKLILDGAISGYPNKTFKPNNNITRAEFATVLVKAFKLENKSGKIFADTQSHWAKDYIATAAANGIVSGYGESTFGPDDLITREQMAVMIAKVAELTDTDAAVSFTDIESISNWAKSAVASAAEAKIISGYTDGTFKPQVKATRAEAVTVIVKSIRSL